MNYAADLNAWMALTLRCELNRCTSGWQAVWRAWGSYPCGCREIVLVCDPCMLDFRRYRDGELIGRCELCGTDHPKPPVRFGSCILLTLL